MASSIERIKAYAQVRFETPDHNRAAHYISFPFAEAAALATRTETHGLLPESGAAIVIANHASWKDPFIMHWYASLSKRTMRTFAKKSLLKPDAQETERASSGRTAYDPLHDKNANPAVAFLRKTAIPFYYGSFNPILVDIGGMNRDSIREADATLASNQLLGVFIQGHRKPPLDLLDVMRGTAAVARRNPTTPIIPIGLNGTDGIIKKVTLKKGDSFTYKDIPKQEGKDELTTAIEFMADRIAEQIDDFDLKPAWWLNRSLGWTKAQIESVPDLETTAGLVHELVRADPSLQCASYEQMQEVLRDIDQNGIRWEHVDPTPIFDASSPAA